MLDEPKILETQAQQTAVIQFKIPRAEIQNVMRPGMTEVLAIVGAQGITPAGPIFSHHFRMDPDVFDFEIGVPVTTPVSRAGRVKPGLLPAATVARTMYHGPYERLAQAWGEFMTWIGKSGHSPADELWECYVAGPETGPDASAYRTELNRPLLRQALPAG